MIAAWILACCLQAPPEIAVDTDRLTLGAVLPLDAGDPRAELTLGFAPQPGLARRFTKVEIASKITGAGLSIAGLELPDSILVRRKAGSLDPDRVRTAVQQAFMRQFPSADITVLSVDVPQTPVGAGALDLTASLPPRTDLTAPVFVRLDVRAPGFSKSVFVRTVVEVLMSQLVLVRPVSAGSSLQADDVELRSVPVRGVTVPLESLESIKELVAIRDLQPGQPISAAQFRAPLMVRKGEVVTVKANSGEITVAASMRAKADGRYGDTIVVEHLSGGGSTSARVIGSRALEALQGTR